MLILALKAGEVEYAGGQESGVLPDYQGERSVGATMSLIPSK